MNDSSKNRIKKQVVLGVDIGTTNIKCYAYDKYGQVIGKTQEKITVLDPGDGRHEIEPEFLWDAFLHVVRTCLLCSMLNADEISCMGISTQRGTFLTWNRETNESFHNFITWKDRRSEQLCNQWNSSIFMKFLRFATAILHFFTRKKLFQALSELKFTSAMVLTRLYWILKHDIKVTDKISQNEALFGTIDTWLIWKLTGGQIHATDPSNACVTGFFDPFKVEWSKPILQFCNIPDSILPSIKNTSDSYGQTLTHIFGSSIPIYAVVGDQQAAMFGSGCFKKNSINFTMGTGSFFNMNTGSDSAYAFPGIYPLIGWTLSSETTYVLECGMHDVGTILSVAQNLGFFDHPQQTFKLAQSVTDSAGVLCLPSACLLETSGKKNVNISSFIGLNAKTSKCHVVRSVLEALAFQVCLLLDFVAKCHDVNETKELRVSGGISKNDFILQLVADLTEKTVKRMKHNECSSIGAAFLAGLHCGIWKNTDDIIEILTECDVFSPNSSSTMQYQRQYLKWKNAVTHPVTFTNVL